MVRRVVNPEILDGLAAEDPAAVRSRSDLRRINSVMGNERWICRAVRKFPEAAARGITEIGAGDGRLAGKLARIFPEAEVAAYDLAPRPAGLAARVAWHRGDLLEAGASPRGGLLVANLFLHHFEGAALDRLGEICRSFDAVVLNEPDRTRLAHALGRLAHPFINGVTRHDMHASIRAGFAAGELPGLLGLGGPAWQTRESSTWRGGRRVVAWRA